MNSIKKDLFTGFILLLSLFLLLPTPLYAQRKKVGVVLSGGGAKGVAHISVLKALEQAGIPIDYIAGTSMGAIVGGLYSIGYTPNRLESTVKGQDWEFLLSDRVKRTSLTLTDREQADRYVLSLPFTKSKNQGIFSGVIKGQNLANLFADLTIGYHDSISFDRLPTPFACVAANVVNGEPKIFRSGHLSQAMRASMAIPGVFTPVRLDSMILVDGGVVDNYPVDVVRAMGAEVVIGVDVQDKVKTAEELTSGPAVINQLLDMSTKRIHRRNVEMTDLYIKINVDGYSAASFNPVAIDSLIQRGAQAAKAKETEILALKQRIGISQDFRPQPRKEYKTLPDTLGLMLADISFQGAGKRDQQWLLMKYGFNKGKRINRKQIRNILYELTGNLSYSGASYNLTDNGNGTYNLNFMLQERYDRAVNVGVRFDSEEIASLLLNGSYDFPTRLPLRASLTLRLGKRLGGELDFFMEPYKQRGFNLTYAFQDNDLNIYSQGVKSYNVTFQQHRLSLGFSDVWVKNFRYRLGSDFEYFRYRNFLFKEQTHISTETLNARTTPYLSYYAQLQYNSFNKAYFASAGQEFKAVVRAYTDNGLKMRHRHPLLAVRGMWQAVIPVTGRFSVQPSVAGRVLFGHYIPYAYQNALGGETFGFFVPQQIPFSGISSLEFGGNSLVVGTIKLRQRMGDAHYLTLSNSYAAVGDKFTHTFTGKHLYGISLRYGYDTLFGPLEAEIGYSTLTRRANYFINMGYYF